MQERYLFSEIEAKWQKKWQEQKAGKTDDDPNKEKFYVWPVFLIHPQSAHGPCRYYTIVDVMPDLKDAGI